MVKPVNADCVERDQRRRNAEHHYQGVPLRRATMPFEDESIAAVLELVRQELVSR
jgi:hypothetical protein